MHRFKHFSFDLWLTLIRSNPEYKKERVAYFHKNYNLKSKSLEEVSNIFRQVDLMCNSVNERTGKNIDSDEMYLMVISMINDNAYPLYDVDTDHIYKVMEALLHQYHPVVYSNETIFTLDHLKQNNEHTLSILSNTGFIRGVTLRAVLKELGLFHFFDFQLYSDEAGLSKPNPDFFKLMLKKVMEHRKSPLNVEEIIHVGDNVNADIAGARSLGIASFLINSNDNTILDLIKNEKHLFLV